MSLVPTIAGPLVISLLRLLLDGYKVASDKFKDKKTPDRIEKIVARAEKAEPTTVSKEDIERSIKEDIDPGDAAIVTGDLEMLSLLFLPTPTLDAFDYWGKLTKLVSGLQTFARKNRLFELRGSKHPLVGEVLLLPTTGKYILPDNHVTMLAVAMHHMEALRDGRCFALLQKDMQEFPIILHISARFNQYGMMGGDPGVIRDECYFYVRPGQQRHWLKFERAQHSDHFEREYEYRLDASDLISIVHALRDDIREYATAIQLDEQKITPLFTAIDAFADSTMRGV